MWQFAAEVVGNEMERSGDAIERDPRRGDFKVWAVGGTRHGPMIDFVRSDRASGFLKMLNGIGVH